MFEWVFTILVVVVGAFGAYFWWRIAARASPYEDEVARQRRKGQKKSQHQPTVVRGFDSQDSSP